MIVWVGPFGCADVAAPVRNRPPSGESVALEPTAFHRGTGVQCAPTGWADPDGDPQGWRFAWIVDGVAVADDDDTLDLAHWARGSRIGCSATPDDGTALGRELVSAEGIAGDAPVHASVAFDGDPVWGLDAVSCRPGPDAGDPDGDPVEWTISWRGDGAAALADDSVVRAGDTLSPTLVASAREWTCEVASASASATATLRPRAAGGNILVIVIDDFGVDKMGAYAEHPQPAPTPNLDAFAADGLMFRKAWVTPQCSSTRAAWTTGRLPRRHGVVEVIEYWETSFHLPYTEVLVPAMLAFGEDFVYDTSFSGKWHLGTQLDDVGADHPNESGWGWYAGSFGNLGNAWFGTPNALGHGYTNWERIENGSWAQTSSYATTVTTDDTIGRMAAMTPPWLAVASYNAGHTPIHLPPADLITLDVDETSSQFDLYDAAIEALDHEIGRLLAAAPPDTTVLVFGDNGTAKDATRPPWDPEQAKGTVEEPGVRVPFLVGGPLVRTPGSESDGLIHAVDVFATIAQIAGVRLADVPDWTGAPLTQDGIGLLPYLADPTRPSLRAINYTDDARPNGPPPYTVDTRAVTDGRWKVIRDVVDGVPVDMLFDLAPTGRETEHLLLGALSVEQASAYVALSGELDAKTAELVYDVER